MEENKYGFDVARGIRPDVIDNNTYTTSAKRVFGFLKVTENPQKSDAIFLVGGGDTFSQAKRAYDLYVKGFSPRIIILCKSGANAPQNLGNKEEQEAFTEKLFELDKGVGALAETQILHEGIAMRTDQEAKSLVPFLKQRGIKKPEQVILTALPYHQRRVMYTFEHFNPDIKFINCPGEEQFDPFDLKIAKRVVGEIRRLIVYEKQNNLKLGIIPQGIWNDTMTMGKFLRQKSTKNTQ